MQRYMSVEFTNFKAFKKFTVNLRAFNILVGPNNAGKSTILSAFRILAAGIRRAEARSAMMIKGPGGPTLAHKIDLSQISVAGENVFYNYDDSDPASIKFQLSDGKQISLYFPDSESCYMIPDTGGKQCQSPSEFRTQFKCPIDFVPILGPVDQYENLFQEEAARLALFNYGAARNFRNIWYHYPDKFDRFRELVRATWPGMDITRPEIDRSHEKPRVFVYCPEERKPREIFWSGFGFQVWVQMLTHIIQSSDVSLFLIDEPDIYLHSDLQRQLVSMLRSLGPDILIATHSTEIITEAETDEIVIINKNKTKSFRIKNPGQLEAVFSSLGSNLNPILTQLAKTRRALFVEGKDFQLLSKFARKLGFPTVANRSSFSVVPMEGFNPERAKNIKEGMEMTLGLSVMAAAVLDRDYRSESECANISENSVDFLDFTHIHGRKEIENFLLVPSAIDRALRVRLADRAKREGVPAMQPEPIESIIQTFARDQKAYVAGQHLTMYRRYARSQNPAIHEESVTQEAYRWFENAWSDQEGIVKLLPGKETLTHLNRFIQEKYHVSITATAIIDSMTVEEIPKEMKDLIIKIDLFAKT